MIEPLLGSRFLDTIRAKRVSLDIFFITGIALICLIMEHRLPLYCTTSHEQVRRETIHVLLQSLSLAEQQKLDALFRMLFCNEGFSYTLFGERALAYTAYFKKIPLCNILAGKKCLPIESWWKVWEKYQHLFPMNRFTLITADDPRHNSVCIYLINKEAYFSFLNKAHPHSRWVRNSRKTLEELREIFHTFKIQELPNYIEVLGILLGYGDDNAYLFYRRDVIENILTECIPPYTLPTADERIRLQKELDEIHRTLIGVKTDTPIDKLEFIGPLGFIANIHAHDTKRILNKFRMARKKISHEYIKGTVLEVTLVQLTS